MTEEHWAIRFALIGPIDDDDDDDDEGGELPCVDTVPLNEGAGVKRPSIWILFLYFPFFQRIEDDP